MPEKRAKNGQFLPGSVNNPGGRPKVNPEIKEILKAASVHAAERLVALVDSKQEKIALQAVQEILNRTEGKPRDNVQMNVSGNLDVRSQIRDILIERLKHDSEQPRTDDLN